jgi:polyisoprenoid-binding protein YceI
MKQVLLPSIVILALCTAFTFAKQWKADAGNSKVNWELPFHHKKGTFGNLNAVINFDKENLTKSKITASIDVKTIKIGNEKHEAHLLSADFFNAEKFPMISFASAEIISSGNGYIAKGNLTIKDSIKRVEIPFTFAENGKSKATFSGTMTVYAQDFGVMKRNQEGSDKVFIYLEVPVSE